MRRIRQRAGARRDLVEIYRYHAREAGLGVADRFYAEAQATLARLAKMPGMGTVYENAHPSLAGLRYFPLSRFRSYLVFYRTLDDGIEVVRVLHGARDLEGILADDPGIDDDPDD